MSESPKQLQRGLLTILLTVMLLLASSAISASVVAADPMASSQPVSAESQIDWFQIGASALDLAILRPLGTLSTIGGFGLFLASVPFVAPSERIETAWDIFVFGSYDYTFVRPLGEL